MVRSQEDLYSFLMVILRAGECNRSSNFQSFQHKPEEDTFPWFSCNFLIPEIQVLRKTPVPAHSGSNKAISLAMELHQLLALHHYICVLHTCAQHPRLLVMISVPSVLSVLDTPLCGIRRRGEIR